MLDDIKARLEQRKQDAIEAEGYNKRLHAGETVEVTWRGPRPGPTQDQDIETIIDLYTKLKMRHAALHLREQALVEALKDACQGLTTANMLIREFEGGDIDGECEDMSEQIGEWERLAAGVGSAPITADSK